MANIGDTKILVQVIQDLSSARSLMEVMALVRTAARKIATADGATFVLRDNGMCFYADEDAIEPLWKGQRFPLTSCISGWSMLHKEALIVEDIYKDPRIPIAAYSPTFVKSLA
ncbi:MAG: hybrid sensor histidine kinase/response regulator, partial [Bdellovibrio sp.]